MKRTLVLASLLCLAAEAWAVEPVRVMSPDGRTVVEFAVKNVGAEQGCLVYSVSFKGKPVILDSRLGLTFKDAPSLAAGFEAVKVTRAGRKYVAHLYEDAEPDGKSRTNVRISRRLVDSTTVLRAALRPSGGQAVRLVPATAEDLKVLKPYRAP